jgi:D-alanyl-lipoteichoic acid acyltransferase DltB (MBOAT superfamily)
MALGSARLMGIRFPENFNFPYAARSPRDFWKRWHISLSSWIRDYLYLPLLGSRPGTSSKGGLGTEASPDSQRRTYALFVTWAIMGLWHGAAWTFLWWGLYHAALVYLHRHLSKLRLLAPTPGGGFVAWAITLPLMMLGWIPFRAESVTQTLRMSAKLFQPSQYLRLGLRENTYLITAMVLVLVVAAPGVRLLLIRLNANSRPWWFPTQVVAYMVIVAIAFVFLRPIEQFIYFQF